MRGYATRSPPHRLESIPSSDTTDRSPSLRGSKHSQVPLISNHPLNTILPDNKDGVPHPQPFYVTQSVVFRVGEERPPWTLVEKQGERKLLELWDSTEEFRERILEELLKDFLNGPIYSMCSVFLIGANDKLKKDRKLLMWLHENVIEPVVFEQCELSVYEELWNTAGTLTESEAKPYIKMYADEPVDDTFLTFLKDHHRRPLTLDEGKSIYAQRWGKVVYHLNQIIKRASLMENYAVRRIEEKFTTQIASEVLFQEGNKYMEEEMKQIDESQRVEKPPRISAAPKKTLDVEPSIP